MPALINLVGQRFFRLTVTARHYKNATNGSVKWECLCDCGNTIAVTTSSLRTHNTRSCGCYRKEVVMASNTSHGMYGSPEHTTWRAIKGRCYEKSHVGYSRYGGRGITMSDEWKNDFQAFYHDMGPRPSPNHSIERNDNDKGYYKENCCWATRLEQANNTSRNIYCEFDGEIKSLSDWCRELNLSYPKMCRHIRKGFSFEDAADLVIKATRSQAS